MGKMVKQQTSKPDTRLALILTAERLFAEQGFASVSLRQVQDAAGIKNTSAIHYHFGSREELVRAVFTHRFAAVNPRRMAIMTKLKEEHRLDDARALVGAIIYALVPELDPRPEGNHYLRFMERYMREMDITDPAPEPLAEGWLWAEAELTRLVAPLGKTMATLRMRLARLQAISGMASIEATLAATGQRRQRTLMVEGLIDAVVAVVTGPISSATAQALT